MMLLILISFLAVQSTTFETYASKVETKAIKPWELNVVPKSNHFYPNYTSEELKKISLHTKKIPQLAWIGYRNAPKNGKKLSEHIQTLKDTNPDWKFHLWGNDEEHHFMETYFANTSILWAFKSVNPEIGVSYGDIWRYCVLWAYGGFYVDDDSSLSTPLTEIVKDNDTLILSAERTKYSECYSSQYKLSKKQLNMIKPDTYNNNSSNSSNNNNNKPPLQDLLHLFDHPTVNWALFSQPGNLVIENVLRNIVDIFKMEYLKRPVFKIKPHDMRALRVICSTGPIVLAASIKEFCLTNPYSVYLPRMLTTNNYHEYGGVVKWQDEEVQGKDHYTNKIGAHQLDLLAEYENNLTFESLETRFIVAKNTKQKKNKNITTGDANHHDKSQKNIGKTSDYLHRSSSTSTGPNAITPNGLGFKFFHVKNEILVIYPDFSSFLSGYIDGVEEGAPDNIETVDLGELYELFGYRPLMDHNIKGHIEGSTGINGNNNDSLNTINDVNNLNKINDKNVKYNEKNCIHDINEYRIEETKRTLVSDIKNKNTYNNSKVIFAPSILLCKIVHKGRAMFLLHDNGRFGFPDFDTFIAMNFTVENSYYMPQSFLLAVPYVKNFDSVET